MSEQGAKMCADCGAVPLKAKNKTGYCRRCVPLHKANNPETRAKIGASLRKRLQGDPELKERFREQALRAHHHPKAVAERTERWKRDKPWIAGNLAQPKGSEARKRMAATLSATKLAWCPRELRDEYRRLRIGKKIRAAEAREIILAQHERDMQRFRRSIGA